MVNDTASHKNGREIKESALSMETFCAAKVGADPVEWLLGQAQAGMLLLAYADDGVIWGRVVAEPGKMFKFPIGSGQVALRKQTLLMARLFDEEQEIFLWRVDEDQWRARWLQERVGETQLYFDEMQILWGDTVAGQPEGQPGNDFVQLSEGSQGMNHAPPQELLTNELKKHKARLVVRHYLQSDEDALRVKFSRLVKPATEEVPL